MSGCVMRAPPLLMAPIYKVVCRGTGKNMRNSIRLKCTLELKMIHMLAEFWEWNWFFLFAEWLGMTVESFCSRFWNMFCQCIFCHLACSVLALLCTLGFLFWPLFWRVNANVMKLWCAGECVCTMHLCLVLSFPTSALQIDKQNIFNVQCIVATWNI